MNSTTAVAAEAMVNLALTATAVVEIMAKWLNLYPRKVRKIKEYERIRICHVSARYYTLQAMQ